MRNPNDTHLTPSPLPYFGGKRRGGKAAWIVSILPPPSNAQTYIEPFGGMAAVMMSRAPITTEILNDLNERLMNWWVCIRDESAEFARLLAYTPHSRSLFAKAIGELDDMSLPPIRRALAYHIIISGCINRGDGKRIKPSNFFIASHPGRPQRSKWTLERVERLAQRMYHVGLECRDAIELLNEHAANAHAVVYCDPPYYSASTSPYLHSEIDVDRLTAALHAQKGYCAISGYGSEWEHLGWHRSERRSYRTHINAAESVDRIDVVWTNRPPCVASPRLMV